MLTQLFMGSLRLHSRQKEMCWLWILVLFPLLALQAEEPESPTNVTQTQTTHPHQTQDELINKTLQESETDRMWVSENRSSPSSGGWGTHTTPLHTTTTTTTTSRTEYSGRRLPKPSITIRSVNGTCNITLSCAVTEGGGGVSYAWSNSKMSEVLPEGPTLRITQKPPHGSLDYTCTIRNKGSENSSTVSLREHCHDPPTLSQGVSASFYAKYIIPPLIVLVLLLGLFFMYRRKRGRGSHSSTVSICESSDSDNEDYAAVVAQSDSHREAFKSIPEEALQRTEVSPINEDQVILDTQDQPSSQT